MVHSNHSIALSQLFYIFEPNKTVCNLELCYGCNEEEGLEHHF